MPQLTIYHNPRCSKSRQTLELIREHGIEPTIIEYLNAPPSLDELSTLLKQLKLTPRDIMRTKEASYKEQGLDNPSLSEAELLKALQAHPSLIERPLVTNGHKTVLGRPPENVLELF